MSRVIAVKVQYDGSFYRGFQRQAQGPTIQACLEKAISDLSGEFSTVTGSGRTDAGAHALGQVISFRSGCGIPADRWALAMNTKLPEDIRAIASCFAPEGFNARFDATSKQYRYLILPGSRCAALMGRFAWVSDGAPSLEIMKAGARELIGEKDFSSFKSAGSIETSPIRNITELNIERIILPHTGEAGFLVYAEANGFLYKMVRNIVGAIYESSLPGAGGAGMIRELMEARDRKLAPPPAPAGGLYLAEVRYPDSLGLIL